MQKKGFLLTFIVLATALTACGNTSLKKAALENAATQEAAALPAAEISPAPSAIGGTFQNTILVNSSEEVSIVPDIAEIVYSVRTQASTAALCQQQNAESVSQVTTLLLGLEVAESSIQTSDYYMNPVYNYSGSTPRITGYEAVTSLTVSDLPMERLEDILAQSVDNGVNTIQSITYQASSYDESYQQALTKAVDTAHKKAQVLADAAGCQLGAVVNIQETGGYSNARYTDNALTNKFRSMSAKEELADASAGIMAGEIQVSASITVEYQVLH